MKFTSYCHKGGRTVNDDYYGDANKNGIQCFVAADGLGTNGGAASSLAVQTIINEFKQQPELSSAALKHYVTQAQSAILEAKAYTPEYDNIGTTIAVLLTNGKQAVYASCGDTRIYTFRHTSISEVTEDHSEAFEKFVTNHITYSEIRTDPDRHKLLRALGDRISWEPDISEVININSSFSFLICTDGFWNLVTEEEMEKSRRFAFSSSTWLKRMLTKAHSRITENSDNLTAVTICIEKSDVF